MKRILIIGLFAVLISGSVIATECGIPTYFTATNPPDIAWGWSPAWIGQYHGGECGRSGTEGCGENYDGGAVTWTATGDVYLGESANVVECSGTHNLNPGNQNNRRLICTGDQVHATSTPSGTFWPTGGGLSTPAIQMVSPAAGLNLACQGNQAVPRIWHYFGDSGAFMSVRCVKQDVQFDLAGAAQQTSINPNSGTFVANQQGSINIRMTRNFNCNLDAGAYGNEYISERRFTNPYSPAVHRSAVRRITYFLYAVNPTTNFVGTQASVQVLSDNLWYPPNPAPAFVEPGESFDVYFTIWNLLPRSTITLQNGQLSGTNGLNCAWDTNYGFFLGNPPHTLQGSALGNWGISRNQYKLVCSVPSSTPDGTSFDISFSFSVGQDPCCAGRRYTIQVPQVSTPSDCVLGDGNINPGEECDDNADCPVGQGCSSSCMCGDEPEISDISIDLDEPCIYPSGHIDNLTCTITATAPSGQTIDSYDFAWYYVLPGGNPATDLVQITDGTFSNNGNQQTLVEYDNSGNASGVLQTGTLIYCYGRAHSTSGIWSDWASTYTTLDYCPGGEECVFNDGLFNPGENCDNDSYCTPPDICSPQTCTCGQEPNVTEIFLDMDDPCYYDDGTMEDLTCTIIAEDYNVGGSITNYDFAWYYVLPGGNPATDLVQITDGTFNTNGNQQTLVGYDNPTVLQSGTLIYCYGRAQNNLGIWSDWLSNYSTLRYCPEGRECVMDDGHINPGEICDVDSDCDRFDNGVYDYMCVDCDCVINCTDTGSTSGPVACDPNRCPGDPTLEDICIEVEADDVCFCNITCDPVNWPPVCLPDCPPEVPECDIGDCTCVVPECVLNDEVINIGETCDDNSDCTYPEVCSPQTCTCAGEPNVTEVFLNLDQPCYYDDGTMQDLTCTIIAEDNNVGGYITNYDFAWYYVLPGGDPATDLVQITDGTFNTNGNQQTLVGYDNPTVVREGTLIYCYGRAQNNFGLWSDWVSNYSEIRYCPGGVCVMDDGNINPGEQCDVDSDCDRLDTASYDYFCVECQCVVNCTDESTSTACDYMRCPGDPTQPDICVRPDASDDCYCEIPCDPDYPDECDENTCPPQLPDCDWGTCTCVWQQCRVGDGIINPGEQCDTSSDCSAGQTCGSDCRCRGTTGECDETAEWPQCTPSCPNPDDDCSPFANATDSFCTCSNITQYDCTNSADWPTCSGDCPPGYDCIVGDSQCICITGLTCGNPPGDYPTCTGTCPEPLACGIIGSQCGCLNTSSCATDPNPNTCPQKPCPNPYDCAYNSTLGRCLCIYYNGTFNDTVTEEEMTPNCYTFEVAFGDLSDVPEDFVAWEFEMVSYSGFCETHDFTIAFDPTLDQLTSDSARFPTHDGKKWKVGDLVVCSFSEQLCSVEVKAETDGTTVIGVYTLDLGGLTPLCPTCQVPEIPSIIHPIGMYSDLPGDALTRYNAAEAAVNQFISECGGNNCPSHPGLKNLLDSARIHLQAADRYLGECNDVTGEPTCRLSQYYSDRASELAAEGLSLI